ncbi:helix-turn-helix transcriptional regulator [Amycolatopsis acidicola]|uniref:Helix-turn-helix transcriptional regulator n=1 Tax=Amycolatopsis acidicola TaxID=2596893 RepID=A0A5N0V0H7_9PSEU|nr:helix-turn-helix transcriptional regulator [Amycolatopsis acidicola]KAA9157947.1 helix-turn-helix transcriptional regulator [Amycolatopsis acidicola]
MAPDSARNETTRQFGERVRARRDRLGLTQERLAERAGMHWSNVGHIERGRRNLSMENILRLAAALECTPGDLLNGLPVPEAAP